MKKTYFLTGFPGFLSTGLIQQLIDDHYQSIEHIYLLILPQQKDKAKESIQTFINRNNLEQPFFTLVEGDITKPGLNMDHTMAHLLEEKVTHCFHLAAIYDLAVSQDIAHQVNVEGTRHVNQWVKTIKHLERYVYFSTAYVSGTREGRIYESELIKGQTFKNHYELTKYQAEILVKQLMIEGLPVTIFRPGIVKGHSTTGQTSKFDGLYFMLNFLDKLSFLPFIPYFGNGRPEGNFVSVDYVLRAVSYLSIHPIGKRKTYHLTDPRPYQMWELQKILSEYYLNKTPKGEMPVSAVKAPLLLAPIRKWLQVEREAMDYFTIKSSFDTTQITADLEDSGITCPDFKDTLPAMIDFYRKYKDDIKRHITMS